MLRHGERFAPSEQEIRRAKADAQIGGKRGSGGGTPALAEPLYLRVHAAHLADSAIDELKQAIEDCPGVAEVLLDVDTSSGTRRLKFGEAYRVQHTPTLRAELEQALAPFLSAAAG